MGTHRGNEIQAVLEKLHLRTDKPFILQVWGFAGSRIRQRNSSPILSWSTGSLTLPLKEAAFRIRQFLNSHKMASEMGGQGREYVRNSSLLTREVCVGK
jgi:hypothetical protein